MIRALSEQQIRAIIREHPDTFRKLAALGQLEGGDLYRAATEVLLDSPAVLDAVIAAAGLQPPGNGIIAIVMRGILFGQAVKVTEAAHPRRDLEEWFLSELALASIDSHPDDGLLAVVFGKGAAA